jgi:hypothetical protein
LELLAWGISFLASLMDDPQDDSRRSPAALATVKPESDLANVLSRLRFPDCSLAVGYSFSETGNIASLPGCSRRLFASLGDCRVWPFIFTKAHQCRELWNFSRGNWVEVVM